MSLNAAFHIGRSALLTSQAAMQVAGDNMANAATKGFHRRTLHLAPMRGQMLGSGQSLGQGVRLLAIRREIDLGLQARFRDAAANENAALVNQQFLSAMETLQNELSDNSLSSELTSFFNSFSELANSPNDNAVRGLVIQKGEALAGRIASMKKDYDGLLAQVETSLAIDVEKVNDLLNQIATLNTQITATETGEHQVAALRDHRDLLIDELAKFLNVTVVEQSSGAADILVNSAPIVLGGESRGVTLHKENVSGKMNVSIRVKADGATIKAPGGSVGALLVQRDETIEPMMNAIDEFASQLIFHVNRVHSQGQGLKGYKSVGGTYGVKNVTSNLNSSEAGLPFKIGNGSFYIHVTHTETGVRTTHEIRVDGNTMSLDDLIAEINTVVGVPSVSAGVGPNTTLTLVADAGYEMTFSNDTSGALAALGINTFFTGTKGSNMSVNKVLVDDPGMLAAGQGHVDGSNGTALLLANLKDVQLAELGGMSLTEYWKQSVSWLAVRTSAAHSAAETTFIVRASIEAQIQAVSGVSLDEEAINLLTFQRQYQAAARYIGIIDETLQTLLSLGR